MKIIINKYILKNFIFIFTLTYFKIYFKFNGLILNFFFNNYVKFNNNILVNFFNIYYFLTKFYYYYFNFIYIQYFKNVLIYFKKLYYLNYRFYKFFTFVGLGFKKRLYPSIKKNYFFLYFGHRHWIIFKIPSNLILSYLIKRKSIILFSKTKNLLKLFISNFKLFCKESFFKLKGLLDVRLRRRWVFMRRVKIRGLKIKLSKKQKFL